MTRTTKANAEKTNATRKNARGVSHAEIVEFIAMTRGKNVASVTNPERCASIGEKMFDAEKNPLRAYIRIDNSATLETYAEFRARRAARAERKNENANAASAPNAVNPRVARAVIAEVDTDAIAHALETLRNLGIDVSALQASSAPKTSARVRSAASVKAKSGANVSASVKNANANAERGHAQNDREIATICTYLAKLGTSRLEFERVQNVKLDELRVYPLRDIKAQLRAEIAALKTSK